MQALAVISVTVALLGGPIPPGGVAPAPSQLAQVVSGGIVETQLQGRQMNYDAAAGLTTVIGPDWETVRWTLFQLPMSTGAIPPPALMGKGMALQIQSKAVKVGEEQSFDFPWPAGRPQYYLEQVEQDLYRRVAVADKEGYTVTVRATGSVPQLTVELEFARQTFTGGKYDETIRAFVGQPTLIKAIVTATAPLTNAQKTLLVWQPRAEPQPWAYAAGAAPAWVVGEWELAPPHAKSLMMSVSPDGIISIGPRVGSIFFVGLSGGVQFAATEQCGEGINEVIVGTLNPDGTGKATVFDANRPGTDTRTARRLNEPPQAAGLSSQHPVQMLPIFQTRPGPTGVAVLLEVKTPE